MELLLRVYGFKGLKEGSLCLDVAVYKKIEPGNGCGQTKLGRPTTGALEVDGFSIEGVSVGGQETCVMLPALKVAFDIGRCPKRAIDQDFLFITHPHMDHIVSTRFLFCTSVGLPISFYPVWFLCLQ